MNASLIMHCQDSIQMNRIFPTYSEVADCYIEHFEEDLSVNSDRSNKIRAATEHDTDLQEVLSSVLHGWPMKVPSHLIKLKKEEQLSVRNGLLLVNSRIVVPESQREVLVKLHKSHQDINKRKWRPKIFYLWWPGLCYELKNHVNSCINVLQWKQAGTKRAPLKAFRMTHSTVENKLGIYLMEFKIRPYLIIVDYSSGWLEVLFLYNRISQLAINKLSSIFCKTWIVRYHQMWQRNSIPQQRISVIYQRKGLYSHYEQSQFPKSKWSSWEWSNISGKYFS